MFYKGLVSRIYKELLIINNKAYICKYLHRYFTEENIAMTKKLLNIISCQRNANLKINELYTSTSIATI
jgi:hypothetical protein